MLWKWPMLITDWTESNIKIKMLIEQLTVNDIQLTDLKGIADQLRRITSGNNQ